MLATVLVLRLSPFTTVDTSMSSSAPNRSRTSDIGTSSGPKQKNVGKFLDRVRNRGLNRRMSSAVWSRMVVTPQT